MSDINHDSCLNTPCIDIITDVAVNDRLLHAARRQHKQLYEEQAAIMLPNGLEWRIRAIGTSAIARTLDRQIEGFYQHFNAIHHIAGMHELTLQAGDVPDGINPDFSHSNQTAMYDEGFTIPTILEPYVGTDTVRNADSGGEIIRIGLLGEGYYANTISSWHPLRAQWAESDDGCRHYRLGAVIYRVTDREVIFDKNNAK